MQLHGVNLAGFVQQKTEWAVLECSSQIDIFVKEKDLEEVSKTKLFIIWNLNSEQKGQPTPA